MEFKSFLFCFLLILGHSCSSEAQVFPNENWARQSDPTLQGWDEQKINSFNRYIIDSTNVTGLMIIHRGEVVYQYGDIQENSYIASCRKSVLSVLYGKYVENGQINLNQTLENLEIDDVSPLLPIEKQAKIKDLIAARSGIYLKGSNSGDFREFAPERGSVDPGSYWLYNNWDFNIAGYVFEQLSGKNIYDEVESQLAIPLQMQDWDRSLQRKSGDRSISRFQAYHMWFSTRDMARLGLLMLNKGKWEQEQVISSKWVSEMIKSRTSYADAQKNVPLLKEDGLDQGYGYMWWLLENQSDKRLKNAFSAQGALGQSITVYPNIDVVLAYKTKSAYRRRNSIPTQMNIIKKTALLYQGN